MNIKKILIISFASFLYFSQPAALLATDESKFALTITPPLIKINMLPGETWSTNISVVNNNQVATSVYVNKADFKSGEEGGVVFLQNNSPEEEAGHFLLSTWLNIPTEPVMIGPGQTAQIPVIIQVPADAEAGGHYAAVLVGTKPSEGNTEGSAIKTASLLASLIMLNVKGDITEDGRIREFTTDKDLYTDPHVNFTLRFENAGNVHLQPQGQIKIYNMFGTEKGSIDINQKSEFGNVLPKSIRKWQFSWDGEKGFLSTGRYRADLVLTYGDQAKENVEQTLYFWVVDVKGTVIAISSLLFFLLLLYVIIRLYVKRAVRQVGMAVQGMAQTAPAPQAPVVRKVMPAKKEQAIDLRKS